MPLTGTLEISLNQPKTCGDFYMSITTYESNISDSTKQTAAYLKRRAQRLRKKSKYARDNHVRSLLLHNAERSMQRANELYYNA